MAVELLRCTAREGISEKLGHRRSKFPYIKYFNQTPFNTCSFNYIKSDKMNSENSCYERKNRRPRY